MGNLFTSMINSAGALQVYSRQLATIQNNISNVDTAGYAKQTQTLVAMSDNLSEGLSGGVAAGPVLSSRSEYAEQTVRTQFSQLGTVEQKSTDLSQVSSLFDLTSTTGVDTKINDFFNSFSSLSINPNDTLARQTVINSAQSLAGAFNQTATGLSSVNQQVDQEITGMVSTVNQLAGKIRDLNATYMQNSSNASDAGLDAEMHATLEELSETVGFTTVTHSNGTVSVFIGGQSPLVVGDHQFNITLSSDQNSSTISDPSGNDITGQITSGKLAGALEEKNELLPSYTNSLNTLASTLADQVNQQLQTGVDQNGSTPTVDMFSYDTTAGAAQSLTVNSLSTDQIAAASASSPGGNENALDIAAMLQSKTMGSSTYSQYFGTLGSQIGTELSNAQSDQTTKQTLLDQAKSLRSQVSGVSLDEEASELLQVQRAYQASSKVMSMLNDVLDTLMDTMLSIR